MTNEHSAEELRQQRQRVMGDPLGAEFDAVYNDCVWLRLKWDELRRLYGSQERVDLLYRTAPRFFRELLGTTLRDIVMQIARITDSPQTGKYDNLTIQRLPELLPANTQLRDDMQMLVQTAVTTCAFAKAHRDKRLAHNDLLRKLDPAARVMEIQLSEVEGALTAIENVVNRLQENYFHEPIAFALIGVPDGVEALAFYLDAGLKAVSDERERRIRGVQ